MPPLRSSRRFAVVMLLVALTLAAFAGAVDGVFLLIDDTLYVGNDVVQAGLTWEGFKVAWTRAYAANWHPLTWLSLMLDQELFGNDPRGYRLVNVLFHAANAALLFLLLEGLTGALWTAALAAALFAVHPLRVESVAWISERKDVLALFFGLLALLAYRGHARRPGPGRYVLATGAFALGLAAKATVVVWPILLLVLDWWPLGRFAPRPGTGDGGGGRWRERTAVRLLWEKIPWLLLSAAAAVVTYLAQSRGGAVTFENQPLGFRLTNALWALPAYLRAAAWPAGLAHHYPFRERSLFDPPVLGSLLAVAAITLLALGRLRRSPWLAAGWCWYLAALTPVIGLVPIGSHAIADRYTYVSLIGPVVALCWTLAARGSVQARLKLAATAAAVALVIALAGMTRAQTAYWKDDLTLFTRLNELVPDNPVGFNALGYLQFRAGRLDEAERLYLRALRYNPKYHQVHQYLGRLYLQQGRLAEAERHFRTAIALDPRDPASQSTLGMLLLEAGRTGEAVGFLEAVVRLEPELAEARNNLGVALARVGRTGEAMAHFEHATRIDPDFAEARANLEALRGIGGGR